MKLLLNMVTRIFFLKTRRFDWMIEKYIAFMFYLIRDQPINLPFLIISQIKEAVRKSRACLPYGMVFTLIFEFDIDYIKEDAMSLLHTDWYNKRSLYHLGYRRWTIDGCVTYLDRDLLLLIF